MGSAPDPEGIRDLLATRVIPVLLHRGQQLVKGKRFDSWRSVGHALQAVRVHQARGVDELICLDIAATASGRGPDFDLVRAFAEDCFMPLTVGGGVRSIEDIRSLLANGADKVAIGAAALRNPWLVEAAAKRFGAQAVVVAIDVWQGRVAVQNARFVSAADPVTYAKQMEALGAGEILLTAADRDGTLEGYDLDLIRAVTDAVSIPVVAAGGCASYADMAEALRAGAHAVAAGALFQFTDATPKGAARHLAREGFPVRLAA